jgi:DNA repair and recombination protein RAD52
MFSDETKAHLAAKLSPSSVKSRQQGGSKVSYIEGWHVIAEANRIFGFDNWTRETLDIKCVSEKEREIGQQKAPGWGVTYLVKARIIVDGVAREGCGAGHGIDRDLGQAHESAIKEAETDAMKRAFMTFGNPFGLALYDKQQANVGDDTPKEVPMLERNSFMVECREAIASFSDPELLGTWFNSDAQKKARKDYQLDASQVATLKTAALDRINVLKGKNKSDPISSGVAA